MGIDDFLKQVQQDDEEDRLAEQTHATPIEYARSRSIAPQRVYYYLRNKKLASSTCQCGRRVIDMAEADELFGFKKAQEVDDGSSDGMDDD